MPFFAVGFLLGHIVCKGVRALFERYVEDERTGDNDPSDQNPAPSTARITSDTPGGVGTASGSGSHSSSSAISADIAEEEQQAPDIGPSDGDLADSSPKTASGLDAPAEIPEEETAGPSDGDLADSTPRTASGLDAPADIPEEETAGPSHRDLTESTPRITKASGSHALADIPEEETAGPSDGDLADSTPRTASGSHALADIPEEETAGPSDGDLADSTPRITKASGSHALADIPEEETAGPSHRDLADSIPRIIKASGLHAPADIPEEETAGPSHRDLADSIPRIIKASGSHALADIPEEETAGPSHRDLADSIPRIIKASGSHAPADIPEEETAGPSHRDLADSIPRIIKASGSHAPEDIPEEETAGPSHRDLTESTPRITKASGSHAPADIPVAEATDISLPAVASASSMNTLGTVYVTPNTSKDMNEVPAQVEVKKQDVLSSRTADYEVLDHIGEGAFANVVKCVNKKTGNLVAIKIDKGGESSSIQEEVDILRAIRTLDLEKENMVKFLDDFTFQGRSCLVFEMLDKDLYELVDQRDYPPLSINEIRPIAYQVLVALKALKAIGIVHTDIKPDNIVLVNHMEQPFRVKLIDLGLALPVSKITSDMTLQPYCYRAPEVTLGLPITEAIDMWGLGCVLGFLYFGNHLFPLDCQYNVMKAITHLIGQPKDYLLSEGRNTRYYFRRREGSNNSGWRLNTPEEYKEATGLEPSSSVRWLDRCRDLGDAVITLGRPRGSLETMDSKVFLAFFKWLLEVDPKHRLTPKAGLDHTFFTMIHLGNSKIPYACDAREKLKVIIDTSSVH